MCGITGWFSRQALDAEAEDRLRRMMKAIAHRGPDAEGQHRSLHAALGHTRLSIIDLESGQQPMTSSTGRTTIVFNGEIYNYESIRSEIDAYTFRTHSDTEVVLALYETGGIKALGRLRGMYAFALWDHARNEGWLLRDPLGIKPLFYFRDGNDRLVFASEAKSMFASGYCKPALDTGSLHLLMNFRYLPGNRSLFAGVQQLRAGHALNWRHDGSIHITPVAPQVEKSAHDTIDVLRDAVTRHMVSDVEVGAYLSGGIDSATVVALAREQSELQTFTLDVGDDPMESRYAARSAELLDVRNHQAAGRDDIESSLKTMLWHLEVPKINAFQVFELAGFAAQHVKVCLSGLGGDEVFLGYNAHGILNQARKAGKLLPRALSAGAGGLLSKLIGSMSSTPWTERERAALMLQSLGNWPRVYGLLRNTWDSPSLKQEIYGPRMLDAELPDAFDYIDGQWPQEADPVMAMAAYEKREKMVNDMLWQEDRLSMAHGLEVRVPFVDKELFAHTGRLSRDTLMPGGRLKGHMREAVAPLLSQEILERPKSGFQVDAATFYKEHLQQMSREYLSPERVRAAGLFNPGFVSRIEQLPAKTAYRWHFFVLYMMLMTHLWMEVFETR